MPTTRDIDNRPDADDLPHSTWSCNRCGEENDTIDAECQFCDENYEPDTDDGRDFTPPYEP